MDSKSDAVPTICVHSDDEGDLAGGALDDARLLKEQKQFMQDAAPGTPPQNAAPGTPQAVFQAGAQQ